VQLQTQVQNLHIIEPKCAHSIDNLYCLSPAQTLSISQLYENKTK